METAMYYGGPIITMRREGETVEAVVTRGGTIGYAGTLEGAKDYCRREGCEQTAKKVDLKGHTLMPSFIDPHGHITMVAQYAAFADLTACTDFAQIVDTLKKYLKEKSVGKDGIIMGFGYDHNFLKDQRHPDKRVWMRYRRKFRFLFFILPAIWEQPIPPCSGKLTWTRIRLIRRAEGSEDIRIRGSRMGMWRRYLRSDRSLPLQLPG